MMHSRSLVLSIVLAIGLLIPEVQVFAQGGGATVRPIEDFIETQGTFCIDVNFDGAYVDEIVDGDFVGTCPTGALPLLLVPPIGNFVGQSDPKKGWVASVDYAGLADYWAGGVLGTSFSGTVVERPLKDGRAMVEVMLRTENALTWVADDFDFNGPLLFGNRAPDVLGGAEPSLGDAYLQVKFINTAPGAPLPDLNQLFFWPEAGQETLFSAFRNQAKGPVQPYFGVPEGTGGITTGVQAGLIGNPNCGMDSPSAVADCFPAENIELNVIGQ